MLDPKNFVTVEDRESAELLLKALIDGIGPGFNPFAQLYAFDTNLSDDANFIVWLDQQLQESFQFFKTREEVFMFCLAYAINQREFKRHTDLLQACKSALNMTYDTFVRVMWFEKDPYSATKFTQMQTNFARWYCSLDSVHAKKFTDYVHTNMV